LQQNTIRLQRALLLRGKIRAAALAKENNLSWYSTGVKKIL